MVKKNNVSDQFRVLIDSSMDVVKEFMSKMNSSKDLILIMEDLTKFKYDESFLFEDYTDESNYDFDPNEFEAPESYCLLPKDVSKEFNETYNIMCNIYESGDLDAYNYNSYVDYLSNIFDEYEQFKNDYIARGFIIMTLSDGSIRFDDLTEDNISDKILDVINSYLG